MLDVQQNVSLADKTTFEIGGPARYFAEVTSDEEIREAVLWSRTKGMALLILAGGSNVLFPDEGLDLLVIRIASTRHAFQGNVVTAEAGCNLLDLIKRAGIMRLGGWESLAGIPGTIGGAVRGNAGAFGTEMRDVVLTVNALNTITLETKEFANSECDFSYRHSYFKDNPDWVILRTRISLKNVESGDSIAKIDGTIIERERRHLQNVRAAGSYFTNPVVPKEIQKIFETEKSAISREGRVPAGWLIDKCGLKGARVGGAIASEQHPNYLVNTGSATAKDVLELAELIKREVKAKFGVALTEEAAILA